VHSAVTCNNQRALHVCIQLAAKEYSSLGH
jgi:hypothetical protein